ncbi:MAG: Asp23/Gls24 family envelope stress response protein [Caldisericaceae bacterium]|nr:Asp23/Gls24 family envelope stress response protein [Caldisericaceae bacterium]
MSEVIITDEAIESIILNATLSVDGVFDTWRGIEEYIPYVNKDKKRPHGVDFVIQNNILSANVFIVAKYGYDLRKIGAEVQKNIKLRIETMTPFKVGKINVIIEDVKYEH